jgi:methyl coenzyme M reductase alpha subunit
LESRTQDRDEPLTEYIITINNYYKFLNIPVPDTVKVQRVLDQTHPSYRKYTYGQTYANLQDLAEAAN